MQMSRNMDSSVGALYRRIVAAMQQLLPAQPGGPAVRRRANATGAISASAAIGFQAAA